MPSLLFVGLAVGRNLEATLRAVRAAAFWVIDPDANPGRLNIEPGVRHLPRRGHAEYQPQELCAKDETCPREQAETSTIELPNNPGCSQQRRCLHRSVGTLYAALKDRRLELLVCCVR